MKKEKEKECLETNQLGALPLNYMVSPFLEMGSTAISHFTKIVFFLLLVLIFQLHQFLSSPSFTL
jgi:hypothetical protein